MIGLWGFGLTLVLIIAWPLLTIPARVFPKGYFLFWVIISFIWGILATAAMTILPVWESRASLFALVTGKQEEPEQEAVVSGIAEEEDSSSGDPDGITAEQ